MADQLPPLDKFRNNNKSARKISLPTWLRSSNSPRTSQSLPRQHTIDTPESFLTSSGAKTPISPLAVVNFDDPKNNQINFPKFETISDIEGNCDDLANTPTSPISKRKGGGFSGKKWLPEPLRKLSRHKNKKGRDKIGLSSTLIKGSQDNISAVLAENAGKTDSESETKSESNVLDEVDQSNCVETPTAESLEMSSFYLPVDPPVTDSDVVADANLLPNSVEEKMDVINLEDVPSEESGVREAVLKKRQFVLNELISTEEIYLQDLALIVEGYIPEIRDPNSTIPMPLDLTGGKERMVFGNIEAIFEWHRDVFLPSLRRCEQNLIELGPLITKSERKLRMYVVYCQNKPISEYIVAEHFSYFEEIGRKLKHKLMLSDLLIKPIQRIMKYNLMLEDIRRQSDKLGHQEEVESLDKAIKVMTVVPKDANDMMDVGRIQNFEGSITSQGKLLLHNQFLVLEGGNNSGTNSSGNKKAKDCQVFLFEQSIIFSDITGKKTRFSNPSYLYKTHLQLNKLTVKDISEATTNKLLISSTDPRRSNVSFILTSKENQHLDWLSKIEQLLEAQRNFLKKIVNPQK